MRFGAAPDESYRLRRMASLVKGLDVVGDVGYSQLPNPFLRNNCVVGIDVEKCERDRLGNYSDIFQGTLQQYLASDDCKGLDGLVVGELLEHLVSPMEFLDDCFSSLKKGGVLVLSTPNPNSFIERLLTINLSRRYFYTEEHVTLYPQRWLIRIMEMAGFRNVRLLSGGFPVPGLGLIPFPRCWCYQTVAVGVKPL